MTSENGDKRCDFLVVDAVGFLKNVALDNLANKEVITTRSVVNEIKDKATKQRLQVLPYELKYQEPTAEALQRVTDFSKKTGDYASLSATDIRVMAVTYMLETQHVGSNHLRQEPVMKPTVNFYQLGGAAAATSENKAGEGEDGKSQLVTAADLNMPGFYRPDDDDEEEEEGSPSTSSTTTTDSEEGETEEEKRKSQSTDVIENISGMSLEESSSKDSHPEEHRDADEESLEDTSDYAEDITDDDDEEGWITPSNIKEKKRMMNGNQCDEVQHVKVACMTTDFAMQNVLKHMGLNVISTDGILIKETRTWILRCYACFRTTTIMTSKFCPKCGNKTLKRVSVTLNADGTQQIHISSRRQITARGKKFSLPKPQGGKHAINPILTADQNQAQMRSSRLARMKTDALSEDYVAGNSPFVLRDVTSKAASIGVPGKGQNANLYWNKRNPNAVSRKSGNKKK